MEAAQVSLNRLVDKENMVYIYTQWSIRPLKFLNEILTHAKIRMNLEYLVLSEIS